MNTIRISAFGDSVLKGTVLESLKPLKYTLPEQSFTDICAREMDIRIDNFARFGSTLDMGERMLIRHMTGLRAYDYTLLEFGGNDCDYCWSDIAADPGRRHLPNTPVTEFSMKYGRILDRVRELGSSPILLTLPPVDSGKFFAHVELQVEAVFVVRCDLFDDDGVILAFLDYRLLLQLNLVETSIVKGFAFSGGDAYSVLWGFVVISQNVDFILHFGSRCGCDTGNLFQSLGDVCLKDV